MTNETPNNVQPQSDANVVQVSMQTERVLHDFVRNAALGLSTAMKDSTLEFEDDIQWERGPDGHFRESKKRLWRLPPTLSDELPLLPEYQTCVECMKSDAVVGPHLDRLVGTRTSSIRLEADNILISLIYAMLDEEGRLAFTDEKFISKWRDWVSFFESDRIAFKMIAPLPNFVVPTFPLRLNNELVLDRLTDEEVTRCYQVGVIRSDSLRFPFILGTVGVGIRRTMYLPKLIRQGDEPREPPQTEDEGRFGNRPLFRDDLVIDDVLSALRLFKSTQIRVAGFATWTDSPWLKGGTSYRVLGLWPYHGNAELSEGEVPRFLDLWRVLEEGAARFSFSIHRFNLAFDRGFLADRIVDLVIAAESLFLGDLDAQDRGELRFRFALRAAKFIEYPNYNENDVFRVMRRAYDVRSAIVHGGSPKDTGLPDNPTASLPTFIEAIEELVRLGLRKALLMKEDGKRLREAEYWETLVLSKSSLQ